VAASEVTRVSAVASLDNFISLDTPKPRRMSLQFAAFTPANRRGSQAAYGQLPTSEKSKRRGGNSAGKYLVGDANSVGAGGCAIYLQWLASDAAKEAVNQKCRQIAAQSHTSIANC